MPDVASAAEAVRRWVDAAPAESVIDAREAPAARRMPLGSPCRVSPPGLGLRLCSVRRHLYGKHRFQPCEVGAYLPIDEVTGAYDMEHLLAGVDHLGVARHLAGPGGGYAGWTAGWRLGWTKQHAHNFDIAVVGRPRGRSPAISASASGATMRGRLSDGTR